MSAQPVTPTMETLPAYVAALERGWSPDNIGGQGARVSILERTRAAASLFIASAGGVPVESFARPKACGHSNAVRYRIDLT